MSDKKVHEQSSPPPPTGGGDLSRSVAPFSSPKKPKKHSRTDEVGDNKNDQRLGFYTKPSFNDHARYGITQIILMTFALFIFGTLLAWLALAWFESRHGKYGILTKPFFEYAQYVITSLIGVVSVATGFYFGKSSSKS